MSDKKAGVFAILLLVLALSVSALELKTAQDSVSLCPRNTQLFIDLARNDGQSEQALDVKVAGSAAAWSTSIPTGFVLAPGEERAIYTYITPNSNTFPANYDLDVKLSTSASSETAHHSIIVKDCHELATSSGLKQEACPGEKVKYDILINNLGDFQEIYNLKAEGQLTNVVLSESSIKLNPKESKTIYAYVDAPESDGEYEFSVITDSQQSNALSTTLAKLLVKKCYGYNLNAEKEFVEMCDTSKQVIPITITNRGTIKNLYDLSIDGPLWASLDNKKLEINPNSAGTTNLILTPDYSVSGNFEINVNVLAEKGLKATTKIKANVNKCNSIFTNILGEYDEICVSKANKYNVLIKNDGQVANNFALQLTAPAWVKLDSDKSFALDPGMEKTLILNVNPVSGIEPGEYDISLKAVSTKEPGINAEDSMKLKILSEQDCYKVNVKSEKDKIEVYYDGSATVPINIENQGKYKSTYELSISDNSPSFVQLNPSIINVESGDSEVVYAYIAPNGEVNPGTYTATISANLKDSSILASDSFDIVISGTAPAEKESLVQRTKNFLAGMKNKISSLFTKEVVEETPVNNTIEEEKDISEIGDEIIGNIDEIENPVLETPNAEESVVEENKTEEPVKEIVPVEIETTGTVVSNVSNACEELTSINKLMSEGDSFNAVIKGIAHEVKLEAISNDTVFLSIKSDLNYVLLKKDETKSVDLDGDGVSDLEITFNGFKDSKVDITFKSAGIKEAGLLTRLKNIILGIPYIDKIYNYKHYIIFGVLLIVLLIVVYKTRFHKKIVDFFDEEIEEENVSEKK